MGIEKIGMAVKQVFTRGNAGKIGQKSKALMQEYYGEILGANAKVCPPNEWQIRCMKDDIASGTLARYNADTGKPIKYSRKFLKLWNGRQQLLTDYTKLVGSETSNPKDYAIALQDALETGKMPNFNAFTGEKIKHPKSFVKQFKAYQA